MGAKAEGALLSAPGTERTEPAPKKVLFVATVARHLLAFHIPYFRLFQRWGYAVEAACNPAGEAAAFAALGVRLHPVPFRRRPLSLGNLEAFRVLRRLLREECFALVHAHTPVAAFLARLAARSCGFKPVLYTAHGFHFFRGAPLRNWLLYYPLEWLAARWTDGLLVLNEEDYARARALPVRGQIFRVPGVGVELERFKVPAAEGLEFREEQGLRPEAPVAVVVAELSRVKNHEQLLYAWREVLRRLPEAVLLVVGTGERRCELEGLAGRLGLGSGVRFLGFRSDVPRVLAAADVAVLTSRREGLPRVILEAMAAGKPVVATNLRGSRMLVADGETGFLVRVGDVAGTARALCALLADRELSRRMGEGARRRAEPYGMERVKEIMADIYRRFVPGIPGTGPAGKRR
ncbi:MAG: glycosyltransferase family 4 protein [Bacillota bacterium]|nr:glycosyltransferase family 4 protein [Thermoanaerobacteraceae bacterium]